MTKTNAVRMLEKAKIPFEVFEYEYDENDLSGVHAAENLGIEPKLFYKTLVLKGAKNGFFVCCIAVDKEIDLKKAAKAMNDKSAEMLHVKDLLPTTGYIRGGCSPIGMKKHFPTFFDENLPEEVYVSGGTRGYAVKIKRELLVPFVNGKLLDLVK